MRIVGGTFRGRRLAAPRGRDVRPTSDRVREAVFNILGDLHGAAVLDLFAGTGALGLEAVSRGACAATLVESDREAAQIAQRNIDACVGCDGSRVARVELLKGDAGRSLRSLALAGRRFDVVFFDPPYEQTEQLVKRLAADLPTVLSMGGRVVLETSARHAALADRAVALWGAELETDVRRYGDTAVAILRIAPSAVLLGGEPDDDDFDRTISDRDGIPA